MTGNLDTDTGIPTERKPCDDGGRDWSDAFISQGLLGNIRSQEEARKDPPLEPSERA